MCKGEYENRAKNRKQFHMGLITRQGAEKSLSEVTAKTFRSHYPVPPSVPEEEMASKIKMYHNSIFMAGRYNKFSRELPQTPWIVDGNRIMETSVEELITEPLKQIIKIDGTTSIRAQDLIHF